MKKDQKTAVLIHGHFLEPSVWESVMWGCAANGGLGVIPKGLQLAGQEGAIAVYLCSGVPKVGGRKYSPNALDFIKSHRSGLLYADIDYPTNGIYQNSEVQNTTDEVIWCSRMCADQGITRLFLVTAPKHVYRAHKEALVCKMNGGFRGVEIFATASDIDFPNTDAGTVAMLEASHRHDVVPWNIHKYGQGLVDVLRTQKPTVTGKFLRGLEKLLVESGVPVTWKPRSK